MSFMDEVFWIYFSRMVMAICTRKVDLPQLEALRRLRLQRWWCPCDCLQGINLTMESIKVCSRVRSAPLCPGPLGQVQKLQPEVDPVLFSDRFFDVRSWAYRKFSSFPPAVHRFSCHGPRNIAPRCVVIRTNAQSAFYLAGNDED